MRRRGERHRGVEQALSRELRARITAWRNATANIYGDTAASHAHRFSRAGEANVVARRPPLWETYTRDLADRETAPSGQDR